MLFFISSLFITIILFKNYNYKITENDIQWKDENFDIINPSFTINNDKGKISVKAKMGSFITDNEIARVGVVCNPQAFDSTSLLTLDKAAACGALRLAGAGYSSATFVADSKFTQTIATGSTAIGRVVNYNQTTGVLKYWQDSALAGFNTAGVGITEPQYGFKLNAFTADPATGGSLTITPSTGSDLGIDTAFSGVSTVINNKTYYLGQEFTDGIGSPEVKKYSGNIIYVDNRPSITRSSTQKEDIKVILQF